jgi:hypothetical protein
MQGFHPLRSMNEFVDIVCEPQFFHSWVLHQRNNILALVLEADVELGDRRA